MRVLLVDNYDSFTYNLAHQIEKVVGVAPLIHRNDAIALTEAIALSPDAIVLSPGPGRPDRKRDFGVCADLLARTEIPCLGICLGHQGIAHVFGGRIEKAERPMHGRRSRIFHDGKGIFEGIPQGFSAIRYHSLIVAPPLPEPLEATAFDESGAIMALQHETRRAWGVQFHPESILSEWGDALLANFIRLARTAIPSLQSPPRPAANITPSLHFGSSVPAAITGGRSTRSSKPPASRRALRSRWKELDFYVEPEHAFDSLYAPSTDSFWLDGNDERPSSWRWSYMGAAEGPLGRKITYCQRAKTTTVVRNGESSDRAIALFDFLRDDLGAVKLDGPRPPFEFAGGWVGYLGYEMKGDCGARVLHPSRLPDAWFLFADRMLVFSEREKKMFLATVTDSGGTDADDWTIRTEQKLRTLAPAAGRHPRTADERRSSSFVPRCDRSTYLARARRCQSLIDAGESYEICLTTSIEGPSLREPFEAYRALRARNPAPFAAYLRTEQVAVLSASPELFLKIEPDGSVFSRPIKGTAPRDPRPEADEALRRALAESEKERAENLMIVDLVRHDLGRVCEPGSVNVPDAMAIESFSTVHQMVSTIRGKLRPGAGAIDCIESSFPPGSMTGAPKLRTMELLDELEEQPRGIYSGAIGYLGVGGEATFSVVIRTLVNTEDRAGIGVGSAITTLSEPERELDEVLLKAKGILDALDR